MPVFRIQDYLSIYTQLEPLIANDILDRKGLMVIQGATELGKSYLVKQMALDLATGGALFGKYQCQGPTRVLIFQAEIADHRYRERLAKMWPRYKELEPQLWVEQFDPECRYTLDSRDGFKHIASAIEETGAEVVVFDPLRAYHDQNENESHSMNRVLERIWQLRLVYGTAVVLCHHERKPLAWYQAGEEGPPDGKAEGRGSTVIMDRPDTILRLSKQRKDRTGDVLFSIEKLRNSSGQGKDWFPLSIDYDSGLFVPVANTNTVVQEQRDQEWELVRKLLPCSRARLKELLTTESRSAASAYRLIKLWQTEGRLHADKAGLLASVE